MIYIDGILRFNYNGVVYLVVSEIVEPYKTWLVCGELDKSKYVFRGYGIPNTIIRNVYLLDVDSLNRLEVALNRTELLYEIILSLDKSIWNQPYVNVIGYINQEITNRLIQLTSTSMSNNFYFKKCLVSEVDNNYMNTRILVGDIIFIKLKNGISISGIVSKFNSNSIVITNNRGSAIINLQDIVSIKR